MTDYSKKTLAAFYPLITVILIVLANDVAVGQDFKPPYNKAQHDKGKAAH
jgi:hypothetical protein